MKLYETNKRLWLLCIIQYYFIPAIKDYLPFIGLCYPREFLCCCCVRARYLLRLSFSFAVLAMKSWFPVKAASEVPSYLRQNWTNRVHLCFPPRAESPLQLTVRRSDQELWFRWETCYLFWALRPLDSHRLLRAYLDFWALQFQASELDQPFWVQV